MKVRCSKLRQLELPVLLTQITPVAEACGAKDKANFGRMKWFHKALI